MTKKRVVAVLYFAVMLTASLIAVPEALSEGRTKITYHRILNSAVDSASEARVVVADDVHLKSSTVSDFSSLISSVVPETEYVLFRQDTYYRVAELPRHPVFYQQPLPPDSVFEHTGKTDTLLGYECYHARRGVFSNTIDFWYAPALSPNTPYPSLGILDGAALRVTVNDSYGYQAVRVNQEKGGVIIPEQMGEKVTRQDYNYRLRDNHVKKITVFDNEILSFGNPINNPGSVDSDSVFLYSKGTVAVRKVQLPDITGHTVFLKLTERSKGDAYDRTGTVFLVHPGKGISILDALRDSVEVLPVITDNQGNLYQGFVREKEYEPPVELMRFFTPFGVGHYNEERTVTGLQWHDSVYYEQDVTAAIAPFSSEEVWIGAYIANYDKGGHQVSLSLEAHPNSRKRKERKNNPWAISLFNTLNVMEMSGQQYPRIFGNDTLTVLFEVPEGVSNLQLRYISTGHGGWSGGDEFNHTINKIRVDGREVFRFIPWREDCSVFRPYNPASGNFWNGISSSDLSRSGWCPGGVANPQYVPLPQLKPGQHLMEVVIPMGEPEGNSFSSWNVSGLLTGDNNEEQKQKK